jgi:hypothetical protein
MLDTNSLNHLWSDLSQEQISLHNQIKNSEKDNNDLNKQLTIVNALMSNIIKFRNLKNKKLE